MWAKNKPCSSSLYVCIVKDVILIAISFTFFFQLKFLSSTSLSTAEASLMQAWSCLKADQVGVVNYDLVPFNQL